jgi:hypothetical protein
VKNLKLRLLVLVLGITGIIAILGFFVSADQVSATNPVANPTNISIINAEVFQNLWVTGDQLYFVEYNIGYGTPPSQPASATFFMGIYNGTSLLSSIPLNYYATNIIALYLNNASALTWGSSYTITIAGNPAYFPTLVMGVNETSFGLSSSYWVSTPGAICDYVATLARSLQTVWGITLLTSTDLLNSVGSTTFLEAIPGLATICPNIQSTSVVYPTVAPPTYNTSGSIQPSMTGNEPTNLINAFNGIGNWLGFPGQVVGAVLGFGLFLLLAGRLYVATGSQVAAVLLGLPFLMYLFLIGVIPIIVLFMFFLVVTLLAGIIFILGRFA